MIVAGSYVASFDSEEQAAKAAAKGLGCSVSDLKHPLAKRVTASGFLDRFSLMTQIYDAKDLPGDLDDAVQLQLGCYRAMIDHHPLLRLFLLRAKEAPFRRELCRRAYEAFGAGGANNTSRNFMGVMAGEDEAAAILFDLLRSSAKAMDGKDRTLWIEQVHHGTQFHSGWIPLLRKLGVLESPGKLRFSDYDDAPTYRLAIAARRRSLELVSFFLSCRIASEMLPNVFRAVLGQTPSFPAREARGKCSRNSPGMLGKQKRALPGQAQRKNKKLQVSTSAEVRTLQGCVHLRGPSTRTCSASGHDSRPSSPVCQCLRHSRTGRRN